MTPFLRFRPRFRYAAQHTGFMSDSCRVDEVKERGATVVQQPKASAEKGASDEMVRAETAFAERRIANRHPARKIDIMAEYYWPRVTFGEKGHRMDIGDNRYLFYRRHLDHLKEFSGKHVLNVACGPGRLSLYLAHQGMTVAAFDISPASVQYAREFAEINGYGDAIDVQVMDIRSLTYPDDAFDVVTGEAALHHLIKYEGCLENMYRVLKPGGVALFWESFDFDPLIRFLRPINWRRRGYVGEYMLGASDLHHAREVFDEVLISDQSVFYTYSRFFRKPTPLNRRVARLLKRVDDMLLPRLPFLMRHYSLAYMQMKKRSTAPLPT